VISTQGFSIEGEQKPSLDDDAKGNSNVVVAVSAQKFQLTAIRNRVTHQQWSVLAQGTGR
jgi:hypothetical protein